MSEYRWIDCGNGRKVYRRVNEHRPARSHLSAPFTRVDNMQATWNPIDGRHYDSKSSYERAVKDAGCEIVGNDKGFVDQAEKPREYKPDGLREDIVTAMKQQGAL